MRTNRPDPREDQIGFRLLVSAVWLAVTVWMLVCLAMVG